MMRTRFVWFAVGLCASGAAISQFFGRDLLRDRRVLYNDTIKFNALEQRLDKLESSSNPSEVDDKLPL